MAAGFGVEDHQYRVGAAGGAIAAQQVADAFQTVAKLGVGVADGAAGARAGAAARPLAQVRIDADALVPRRGDRIRGATVDAAGAGLDAAAAVGANASVVNEELGLFELAYQFRDLLERALQRPGIGARSQIAHGRQGAVEQGLGAEIQHDIETGEIRAGDFAQVQRLLAGLEAKAEPAEVTAEGCRLGLQRRGEFGST